MMPDRPTSPTVGLTPTMPLALDGHMLDPFVSVPMVIMHKFAETAAPEPELDPQGFLFSI